MYDGCCCRSLERLVRCFTDVTNASCGDKAAKWVYAYKSLLLNPVKWKIFVPLSSKTSSTDEQSN